MKVDEQKEETSLTHQCLAMSMVVNIGYLRTILNQAMLSPQLDSMACWHSLASGNLAEAQSLSEMLLKTSLHDALA